MCHSVDLSGEPVCSDVSIGRCAGLGERCPIDTELGKLRFGERLIEQPAFEAAFTIQTALARSQVLARSTHAEQRLGFVNLTEIAPFYRLKSPSLEPTINDLEIMDMRVPNGCETFNGINWHG